MSNLNCFPGYGARLGVEADNAASASSGPEIFVMFLSLRLFFGGVGVRWKLSNQKEKVPDDSACSPLVAENGLKRRSRKS